MGYPERAPYDRVIATVGVADLAPAWLEQAAPQARIVVPLDVRGTQLSVAFERDGPIGPWTSRSLAPCGFMRMRGSLAGPERVVILAPGLSVLLPDGTVAGEPGPADSGALAALLTAPSGPEPTGVRARPARVFWELGLWLATREPRSVLLNVEGPDSLLAAAALPGPGLQTTVGIADSGGIALLTADHPAGEGADHPAGEGADRPAGEGAGLFALRAAGFGPRGGQLAADLAAQVRAWDQAGRPGLAGLHVDAYPRTPAGAPDPGPGALVMERPATRFAVYHD